MAYLNIFQTSQEHLCWNFYLVWIPRIKRQPCQSR